jgi:hypothetical protein
MLASTMQFSKYGRSRQPSRRVPRMRTSSGDELRGGAQRGRSAGGRS